MLEVTSRFSDSLTKSERALVAKWNKQKRAKSDFRDRVVSPCNRWNGDDAQVIITRRDRLTWLATLGFAGKYKYICDTDNIKKDKSGRTKAKVMTRSGKYKTISLNKKERKVFEIQRKSREDFFDETRSKIEKRLKPFFYLARACYPKKEQPYDAWLQSWEDAIMGLVNVDGGPENNELVDKKIDELYGKYKKSALEELKTLIPHWGKKPVLLWTTNITRRLRIKLSNISPMAV